MKSLKRSFFVLLLALTALNGAEVEVLHWWTSGGEAKSIGKLKKMVEKEGHSWKDFSVEGGSGLNAMIVLKGRAISGNPPSSAQIKGPSIQEWARLGVLANLDEIAKKEKWDTILPPKLANHMKYQNHYVAVPVNVHKINWMWINTSIFKKANAKIPTTWDEFQIAAKKIQKAGFIPVAHGDQPWQEATLFEMIVLGVGGVDFYKKAFVSLDTQALKSKTMQKAFDTLKMVKSYTDKYTYGRDWNDATSMVYNGKAAMQFMGDWAKGEFRVAHKKIGNDYKAVLAPQTKGAYIYTIDSFVMFKQHDQAKKEAQNLLAKLILSQEFQTSFNQKKGSVPVINTVNKKDFDSIAQQSMKEIIHASKNNTLLPSMAHQMSISDPIRSAIFKVIANFSSSNESSKEAANKLAQAVKNATKQ